MTPEDKTPFNNPKTIMEQIQAKKKEMLFSKYIKTTHILSSLLLSEWNKEKTIQVIVDNDILTDIQKWLRLQGITYGELKRNDTDTKLILSGW